MPTITPRTKRNGTTSFQVAVRLAGAPPFYKSFDSATDAERFASGLEGELREQRRAQTYVEEEPALARFMRENVASIVSDFLDNLRKKADEKDNAPDSDRKGRRCPYLGTAQVVLRHTKNLRVCDFDRRWVKSHVEFMRTQRTIRKTIYSYESIEKQLSVIKSAIKWRADELDLPEPQLPSFDRIFPKKYKNERDRRPSREELAKLYWRLRAMKVGPREHWVALVRLALETAARLQELVLAEWEEFDLTKSTWILPAGHTKCDQMREIPLSRKAVAILRRLRFQRSATDPRVLHRLGTPITVSQSFIFLRRAANLHDIRFHDLRHEAISRMVLHKRKLGVFEIMTFVGHSSIGMFHRYTNLRAEELVERME